jgi:predicted DsbA family dithiol-disulfide isomerase
MSVELRWISDPACPWSWASEPKLRRLLWEFGPELEPRWVMGGLARSYGSSYRDSEGAIGAGADCFADLIAHWLTIAAETGMPIDPRLWTRARIASTYPACQAAIAASEQGWEAGYRYLRALREGLMVEGRKLDHPEALIALAGGAGLDLGRFEIDLHSNAIVETFAAHLEEVRNVPDEAREQGQVKTTEGHERLSFPSAYFRSGDGERRGVFGWQPFEAYREAAIAVGAEPRSSGHPAVLDALERFGRCATRELEELTGRPRVLVEAELWGLAREWRLRPVPALTGTLWEKA